MVEPRKCIIDRMWILIFFDHRCYCFAIFAIVSSFVASMDSTSETLPRLLLREIKIRVFFCSGDTHLCCLYFCTAVPAEPFWNAEEIIPGGSNQLWNLHLLYGRNMSSRMENWWCAVNGKRTKRHTRREILRDYPIFCDDMLPFVVDMDKKNMGDERERGWWSWPERLVSISMMQHGLWFHLHDTMTNNYFQTVYIKMTATSSDSQDLTFSQWLHTDGWHLHQNFCKIKLCYSITEIEIFNSYYIYYFVYNYNRFGKRRRVTPDFVCTRWLQTVR